MYTHCSDVTALCIYIASFRYVVFNVIHKTGEAKQSKAIIIAEAVVEV